MKYIALITLVSLAASGAMADQSTDKLRKEFEAYKISQEARINRIENREGRATTGDPESWKRSMLGFEFHGYFRAGYGVNGNGDAIEAFKAPNSGAKYRLGNEAETYIETTFQQNFQSRALMNSDIDFFTKITLAYVTPTSNNNTFDTTTSVREAYAGARGIWDAQKDALFWAGNRFYENIDIHINDFFFRDLSGFGGGVEDILVGDRAKVALAWLGGTIDELSSSGRTYTNDYHFNKNMVDLRFYDLGAGIGKLAFNLDLVYFSGDDFSPTNTVESSLGWAVGAILTSDLSENMANRISAQYGVGSAENFKTIMTAPQGIDMATTPVISTDDAKRLRLTDDIVIKTGTPVSLQAVAVYEHYNNGMGTDIDWVSVGARPVYHFNEYFSLAFEGGADYTNQKDGPEGVLGKFTLAPQIQPGFGHFARPSIRAFVTYAIWSDGFGGRVASSSYGTDTQGTSFGIQMEAWW